MDQRLTFVTLTVQDVSASRRFYVDGLGWRPEFDEETIVMIRVADRVLLALWSRAAAEAEIGPVTSGGTPPVTLAHNVATDEDVDAVLARAARAGATVLDPVRREWGGYSGYFVDPDGFRWEVAHLPSDLGRSLLPG